MSSLPSSTYAMLPPGKLLTTSEIAERLHLTCATIRKWAREGRLPAVKYGDDWRYELPSVGAVMGRKKVGYEGPKGLIKRKGSKFWYTKVAGKIESTGKEDEILALVILHERKRDYYLRMAGSGTAEPGTRMSQGREWQGGQGSANIPRHESIGYNHSRRSLRDGSSEGGQVGNLASPPLFSTLISRYLSEVSPGKARSGRNDRVYVRMPVKFLGNLPLGEITPQKVYQYQEWRLLQPSERLKRPVSWATINREVALIKHALHKAVRWGMIDRSPLPKGEVEGYHETPRDRYISDDEMDRLRIRLGSHRTLLDTLYYTAQRFGRICGLQWRQIDFTTRTIKFTQGSRNKQTTEMVYINDPLLAILKELYEERRKRAIITPFVFAHKDGSQVKGIRKAWANACRKAGVRDARLHDIRHKAITDMAKKVSMQKVKQAVGHAQIETTAGYTHLSVDDVREAFEALG